MRRRLLGGATALAVTAGLIAVAGPRADAGSSAPSNLAAITIAQAGPGTAYQAVAPYPSSVSTWGLDGPITDVNVDLNNVTFGMPTDIDILLVSPQGTAVMLMSGGCPSNQAVIQQFWTFDDEAATQMPSAVQITPCTSGSWRPSPYALSSVTRFPAPAPPPSSLFPYYNRNLSAFRGENPNGTWRLFVHDRQIKHAGSDGLPTYLPQDHGVILGGFRVVITTQWIRPIVIPATADGAGPASLYPAVQRIAGQNGRIRDVFVYLRNLSHSRPDDLDVVLVAPGGQKVMLMSDACGGIPMPNGTTYRFNDRDPQMPDQGICNTGQGGSGLSYAPTNHAPADSLPAPAPAGPYATSSLSLRGTDPNGEWKLYVHDDLAGHSGYLESFQLSFELSPPVELDTTAPNTFITGHPKAKTAARRARFTFTTSEAGVTYECRLDDRPWASCASPRTLTGVAIGRHVFRTRATDAAGNRDPSPASWAWRIRR